MFSYSSLSNFENFDCDSLKRSLKAIPLNRTNFYFETKGIHGFKEDLREEIHDLLVELQASEEHMQRIIAIFNLFIDRHEKILAEKEEIIYNYTSENEKNLLKIQLNRNSDVVSRENLGLLEKIDQLTREIEEMDNVCSQYEQTIEKLKAKNIKTEEKIDYEAVFLKFSEAIKIKFPTYFCKCHGHYDDLLRDNSELRGKIFKISSKTQELQQENQKFSEKIYELNQQIHRLSNQNEILVKENENLKIELSNMETKRDRFLDDITETMNQKYRFHMPVLKIRSLSAKKKEEDPPEKKIIKKKVKKNRKNPLSAFVTNQEAEVNELRTAVRHKTRAFTKKFTNLLSEIEKSLKPEGKSETIFEAFEENIDKFVNSFKKSVDEDEKCLNLNRLSSNRKKDEEKEKENESLKEPLLESFVNIEVPKEKNIENSSFFQKLFSCCFSNKKLPMN